MANRKLPELDLSGVTLEIIPASTMAARKRVKGPRERSKAQKTVDAMVRKAYEKWVSQGKPENFGERPGGHARCPAEQQATVESAIRSAGRLMNLSIRFGSIEVADGYADVVFSATDRAATPETAEEG